jgi:NADH dehydrogenase FAD-containing subunit
MKDDLPYRTPITQLFPAATGVLTSAQDEMDYSSLVNSRNEMAEQMNDLLAITSLDLEEKELTLKEQVKANQIAYDILYSALQTLDSAIQDVKTKWESRG